MLEWSLIEILLSSYLPQSYPRTPNNKILSKTILVKKQVIGKPQPFLYIPEVLVLI
jgi:hypothetical protein